MPRAIWNGFPRLSFTCSIYWSTDKSEAKGIPLNFRRATATPSVVTVPQTLHPTMIDLTV